MAIGTSGYIESIHTRVDPVKPMDRTWSNIGAAASLVGSVTKLYSSINDIMSDKNTFREVTQAEKEVNAAVSGFEKLSSDNEKQDALNAYRENVLQQSEAGEYSDLVTRTHLNTISKYEGIVQSRVAEQEKMFNLTSSASVLNTVWNTPGSTTQDLEAIAASAADTFGLKPTEVVETFLKAAKAEVFTSATAAKNTIKTADQLIAFEKQMENKINKLSSPYLLNNSSKNMVDFVQGFSSDIKSTLASVRKDFTLSLKNVIQDAATSMEKMEDIPSPTRIDKAIKDLTKLEPTIGTAVETQFNKAKEVYKIKKQNRIDYDAPNSILPKEVYTADKEYFLNKTSQDIMIAAKNNDPATISDIIESKAVVVKEMASRISTQINAGDENTLRTFMSIGDSIPIATAKKLMTAESYDKLETIQAMEGLIKDKQGNILSLDKIRDFVSNTPPKPTVVGETFKRYKAKLEQIASNKELSVGAVDAYTRIYNTVHSNLADMPKEYKVADLETTIGDYIEKKYKKVEVGGIEVDGIDPSTIGRNFTDLVLDKTKDYPALTKDNMIVRSSGLKDPDGHIIYNVGYKTEGGVQTVEGLSFTKKDYGEYIRKYNNPDMLEYNDIPEAMGGVPTREYYNPEKYMFRDTKVQDVDKVKQAYDKMEENNQMLVNPVSSIDVFQNAIDYVEREKMRTRPQTLAEVLGKNVMSPNNAEEVMTEVQKQLKITADGLPGPKTISSIMKTTGAAEGQVVSDITNLYKSTGRLSATGAYQIMPNVLKDAIKELPWLTEDTTLTPEVQDRIATEYLLTKKRPAIKSFVEGNGSIDKAINAMANEWASLKGVDGSGKYSGQGGKASPREALMEAKKTGSYQPLLDLIKQHESNGSYGAFNRGSFKTPSGRTIIVDSTLDSDIPELTVNEILNRMNI